MKGKPEAQRVLKESEAYRYYVDKNGQQRCVYARLTEEGRVVTTEGQDALDCICQADRLENIRRQQHGG